MIYAEERGRVKINDLKTLVAGYWFAEHKAASNF
jgi:hypothetical protein